MKVILLRDAHTKVVVHSYIVSDQFRISSLAIFKARANGLILEERPTTHITSESQMMSELDIQRHTATRRPSPFAQAFELASNG